LYKQWQTTKKQNIKFTDGYATNFFMESLSSSSKIRHTNSSTNFNLS
jgi:hypothetical protein